MINLKTSTIFYYLIITFLSIENAPAQQQTLNGKVVNIEKLPVEFIHATLLKNDTIFVEGMTTDSLGSFLFKAERGNYKLILEQFGTEYFNQYLELNQDMDLGEIEIDDSGVLEGITITARKKLIEQKVDRMVFNVENSIASQGMSVVDALQTTPMVRVQNGNISIVGKGSVMVMINDRIINISESELTNYLQSIRSDDVSKIEVITAPPAKYEARGNSGIINIILKNNPNLGWSGNISSNYQKNSSNGFGSGLVLNYNSNKVTSSIKLRQNNYSSKPIGTRNLIGDMNSIYNSETRKDNTTALGVNYSLNYKINQNQNAGIIYDFNNSKNKMDANGISKYKHSNVTDSIFKTTQQQLWKSNTHILNLYYDIKLDTVGKKLNIAGNYLNNAPDRINDFKTLNINNQNSTIAKNNSLMNYNIYSGQIDLTLPYNFGIIETGLKYTLFNNDSKLGYYNFINQEYILNPDNSNSFNYKEQNYSGYLSFQKEFNEKWSFKAGARYEYTKLLSSEETYKISNNKYGKFFPTAYLSYSPSDNQTITLNYSRRIERPSFQSLNPFRWYTNPYTYFTGNPTLLPSFSDNIELTYTLNNKFSSNLFYQYNKDGLSNIATLVSGEYVNEIKNSYNENVLGIQLNYNNLFFNIWETATSVTGSYTETKSIIQESEGLNVYTLSYSIDNTIALNDNKTWFVLLNYWHDLPYVYANINIQNQMSFSAGAKAFFFNKKLTVNAILNDIFKTMESNGYSYNSGFRSEFTNYFDSRKLTLSLSYSFGNKKVDGNNKNIDFDEKSRAN